MAFSLGILILHFYICVEKAIFVKLSHILTFRIKFDMFNQKEQYVNRL